MNEPIYQAWRAITPVEGESIPEGACCKCGANWLPDTGMFSGYDEQYKWRVPVPVIPESVAVELIQRIARNGFVDTFRVYPSDAVSAEQLRELVIAKLREMSQEIK